MTHSEQIARAVIDECAKVCREMYHGGIHLAAARRCASAIDALNAADLVAALPEREPVAESLRDKLGRRVREVWIKWAQRQPTSKASWLVSYDELSECDKEADRCIGMAIWGDCIAEHANAIAFYAAPVAQPDVEAVRVPKELLTVARKLVDYINNEGPPATAWREITQETERLDTLLAKLGGSRE